MELGKLSGYCRGISVYWIMSEISELLQTYYNDQKAWNADYVCVIYSFFDSYFHQILNN